jgi:hypothetical protein
VAARRADYSVIDGLSAQGMGKRDARPRRPRLNFTHEREHNVPAKKHEKQPGDPKHREHRGANRPNPAIGEHVLQALGRPDRLHAVQVRPLWEGRYRVNVLVGADATAATIAHSYFLVADDDGNVLASTPDITRQY